MNFEPMVQQQSQKVLVYIDGNLNTSDETNPLLDSVMRAKDYK